jgi:hypothetical protein
MVLMVRNENRRVFTIFWSKEVYVGLIEKRESLTSDEKKPG